MKYKLSSVVLYFGKYTQQHHNGAEIYCHASISVIAEWVVNGVVKKRAFRAKPRHLNDWFEDAEALTLFEQCKKRGSKAVKINELSSNTRWTYRIELEDIDKFPHLQLMREQIENEEYGFTVEMVDLGGLHSLVTQDGDAILDKKGKPIQKQFIDIFYFSTDPYMSKEITIAEEKKKWRLVESAADILRRLAEAANSNH